MHVIDLSQRLHIAEGDFLTALQGGSDFLSSYHQKWSALPEILRAASRVGTIDQETLALAHSVASRIANLASCFLDIKRGEESFTTSLQSDCDTMLHRMATLNLNAQGHSSPPENPNGSTRPLLYSGTRSDNAEISYPTFLFSAHQWLVDNLHNPYPTAEVKNRIAAASSCQVSSVNSWFTNARRRIGWTVLCREHFSNCRADMIDAAYRALVEEDPRRVLSPRLRHSFIAMKVAADGLYSSTFTRSALTGDLDATVQNKRKESVEVEKRRQLVQVNHEKTERSYPSPARSIAVSPVPALDDSLTDESEEEEDVVPPILAGSKRRRSLSEPVNQPPVARRPIKRLRHVSLVPIPYDAYSFPFRGVSTTPQAHLPSPPSSMDGTEVRPNAGSPRPSEHFLRSGTNKALPSHTRHVSDVHNSGMPKRLSDSTAAPCLHTVADSLLPCADAANGNIDNWFDTDFDSLFAMPPPVDSTEPDFSTSWQVELFRDYCIPQNPKCGPRWPSPNTNLPTVTHPSEFNSLLQSIGPDSYAALLDTMSPSVISGVSHTGFLDPSIPDISHIDWTSLLDGSDTYQSAVDPTFSKHPALSQPLPDTDLFMLQLPVTPTTLSHNNLGSKGAKLSQLYAMQEAVRRMEEELQLDGVVL